MDAAPEFAFHHVGISVPDLEAVAQWWEQMFGFKVVKRFRIEPADADVVVLAKGDLNVELFQANGATPLADDRRIPIVDRTAQSAKMTRNGHGPPKNSNFGVRRLSS
jgi:catechol 2,3-dioxygenase-like lactoylglutathione lyase family enzyme